MHLGIAFYQDNKFDEAIKCFDEAIKFKLDYAEAFYTKALSYQKKNLIEDAIINFELAIQHNPNNINPIIKAIINSINISAQVGNFALSVITGL